MTKTNKQIYILDGSKFSSFQEFAQHFSETVLNDYQWQGNLDAFNDILRGGFGTPEGGFILQWKNSALSRERLGHAETAKWLEERIKKCHPSNISRFQQRLAEIKQGRGKTLFDTLVEIISVHGVGGHEAQDEVELFLL
jgi:RNAse (barnase) inhibitor barstar